MDHYLTRNIDFNDPKIAEGYDELPFWSAAFGLLLLSEIPMLRVGKVLDVGCGTGFPLTVMAARMGKGVEVTGLDLWEAAEGRANNRISSLGLGNARIIHGSALEIPFEDNQFDLVTANLVLNNLDDPAQMMCEAFRVLKPGGRFCLTTNLQGTFQEVYTLLMDAMAQLGLAESLHLLASQSAKRKTALQVQDLFFNAGLRQVRLEEASHFPRWSDGSAFLNDPFIVMGFLQGWKDCIPESSHQKVFQFVEKSMNAHADGVNGLRMTVPMLYAEGQKPQQLPNIQNNLPSSGF